MAYLNQILVILYLTLACYNSNRNKHIKSIFYVLVSILYTLVGIYSKM